MVPPPFWSLTRFTVIVPLGVSVGLAGAKVNGPSQYVPLTQVVKMELLVNLLLKIIQRYLLCLPAQGTGEKSTGSRTLLSHHYIMTEDPLRTSASLGSFLCSARGRRGWLIQDRRDWSVRGRRGWSSRLRGVGSSGGSPS